MGFSGDEVDFLRSLEGLVDFRRTLTLGRQSLRLSRPRSNGGSMPTCGATASATACCATSVPTLVDSMDASDFEGATVVHDLNLPAPTTLVGRYTAVIDAGTVEHVFNVPEALRTAMSLVAHGGHLVLMAPCNNNPGHGFYQFTPELVFRSLSTSNGFAVRSLSPQGGSRALVRRRRSRLARPAARVPDAPVHLPLRRRRASLGRADLRRMAAAAGLRGAVGRDEQVRRSSRHDAVAGPPWGGLAHRREPPGHACTRRTTGCVAISSRWSIRRPARSAGDRRWRGR